MKEAKLSVILATDSYSTIRRVVERWRRQDIRDQIEIVLVAPSSEAVSEALVHRDDFAGIQIVTDPVTALPPARAAGIRAATAPLVFVGETHSYPLPGFAKTIVESFSDGWSLVTPSFANANPKGVLSWAGFLSDYGRWAECLPAGEISEAPIYNAAYRTSVLVQLGDTLVAALSYGDLLSLTLRGGGHRVLFRPEATLEHVNVSRPWHWVKERFVAGLVIASSRVTHWSLVRRAAYIPGSILIPIVLFWRIMPGVLGTVRKKRLPWATIPVIVAGMIIKAAGEMAGYAGLGSRAAVREMHKYEIYRFAYVRPGE